jgi:DNA-binding transcriptional MerR regulator
VVPHLLSVSAMARLVGKSEETIRDLDRRGVIKAQRDSANRRQFSPEQVEAARAYYASRVGHRRLA